MICIRVKLQEIGFMNGECNFIHTVTSIVCYGVLDIDPTNMKPFEVAIQYRSSVII